MQKLMIAYTTPDEDLALRLATDLQEQDYEFGELSPQTTLIAIVPAELDTDLTATIEQAQALDRPIIAVTTAPGVAIPPGAAVVDMSQGYRLKAVQRALNADVRGRNTRFGLWFGGGIVLLFILYTISIAVFDIEAPQEEFERLYTRDAATINAFAQEYIPRSTEQAAQFEATLDDFPNRDLATVVVATATQAAAEGGFTPQPTGQIIGEPELSVVRQTATGRALEQARQTQQADLSDEAIGATATAAAATANADLAQQQLTVTAVAGD